MVVSCTVKTISERTAQSWFAKLQDGLLRLGSAPVDRLKSMRTNWNGRNTACKSGERMNCSYITTVRYLSLMGIIKKLGVYASRKLKERTKETMNCYRWRKAASSCQYKPAKPMKFFGVCAQAQNQSSMPKRKWFPRKDLTIMPGHKWQGVPRSPCKDFREKFSLQLLYHWDLFYTFSNYWRIK